MKIHRKAAVALCCLFLSVIPVFAEDNQGQIHLYYKQKDAQLQLLPSTETAHMARDRWYLTHSDAPGFMGEALYVIPKKDLYGASQMEVISRLGRSFSTMEGIQYYSNSRKKYTTLYTKAYTVDDPKTRKPVPDHTSGNANGTSGWFYLHDKSFGGCLYSVDFLQNETDFGFFGTAADNMTFMGFKAVKKQDMHLNLLIHEEENTLIVYILVQADFMNVPLLDGSIEKSFNARLEAIYTWFKESYYEN